MPKRRDRVGTHFKRYSARVYELSLQRRGSGAAAVIRGFSETVPRAVTRGGSVPVEATVVSVGAYCGAAVSGTESAAVTITGGSMNGSKATNLGSKVSHLEHAFINESTCSFGNRHVLTAPTVTPESPSSPPTIKHMKAVADELFEDVSVCSSSKHEYSKNVMGHVVDDPEYIEEVEEIRVGLCYNCLPMLNKTVQDFLLNGSVCDYCSKIVHDHVHLISRKYEPTSFNASRTLRFVPIGKKRKSQTGNPVSKEKRHFRADNETHPDNESKASEVSLFCHEELK